jgi:hypothetical protein
MYKGEDCEVRNGEVPISSCSVVLSFCLEEPSGTNLLLIVRTPGCEPDAFRIQVAGVDAVLNCSEYNLKELKSKRQAPFRLILKMRKIPPVLVFFNCYEELRDPWLLHFDP